MIVLPQCVIIPVPNGSCIHQRIVLSCSTAVVFSSNTSSFQSLVLVISYSVPQGSVPWRLFHRLILSKVSSVLQCVTFSDPCFQFVFIHHRSLVIIYLRSAALNPLSSIYCPQSTFSFHSPHPSSIPRHHLSSIHCPRFNALDSQSLSIFDPSFTHDLLFPFSHFRILLVESLHFIQFPHQYIYQP